MKIAKYKLENRRVAGIFLATLKASVLVVHHNDADGLCAAASLSRAFDALSLDCKLLPLERIFTPSSGCLIFADLGGQSSGLIGRYTASADRQLRDGALSGVNGMLLSEAMEQGLVERSGEELIFPAFGKRKAEEITGILDLLGSIGFYSGGTMEGLSFLLGKDRGRSVKTAASLLKMKNRLFEAELERIKKTGGIPAFPDFMQLIPEAVEAVGGIADGCHRYAAAALIDRGSEPAFIEALERVIKSAPIIRPRHGSA